MSPVTSLRDLIGSCWLSSRRRRIHVCCWCCLMASSNHHGALGNICIRRVNKQYNKAKQRQFKEANHEVSLFSLLVCFLVQRLRRHKNNNLFWGPCLCRDDVVVLATRRCVYNDNVDKSCRNTTTLDPIEVSSSAESRRRRRQ